MVRDAFDDNGPQGELVQVVINVYDDVDMHDHKHEDDDVDARNAQSWPDYSKANGLS